MAVALLAFVAAFPLPADKPAPNLITDASRAIGRTLVAAVTNLDVRVRCLLIHKGMTEKNVSRILGGGDRTIFFVQGNPKPLTVFHYAKRDVYVYYDFDENGEFRVDRLILPAFRLYAK